MILSPQSPAATRLRMDQNRAEWAALSSNGEQLIKIRLPTAIATRYSA
ncbi:hypothetical protein H6F74_11960 [Trichocoleus sp. FACHB-90]|nr:hypothetical protein [Trichocoleus sp. FACHB-90]MBD1926957.1 hypothetical protein [Trichocoleus sp. FACHB-90]